MVQTVNHSAGVLKWALGVDPADTLLLPGQEAYRLALTECLLDQGEKAPLREYPQGLQLNYHTLRQFPEYKASFAHAGNWGAALISNAPEIVSLGIDIEKKERKMLAEVHRKFAHGRDVRDYELLELWTIKEAAYKSLFSQTEKSFFLKDIAIPNPERFEFDDLQGHFILQRYGEFIVTIAILTK